MTTVWEAEQRIREGRRKPNSADKILKALEGAGKHGLWNYELQAIGGLSWHRRVGDLRARGVNIRTERKTKGSFKYVYNQPGQ